MFPLNQRDTIRPFAAAPLMAVAVLVVLVASTVWHAFPASGAAAANTRPVPAVVPVSAPIQHPTLVHVDKPIIRVEPQQPKCPNKLARLLEDVGFEGRNHQEAWAIAMRESRGRAKAISATNDYGLFQFNRAAHSTQSWWDSNKLLTAKYNAEVAFEMSRGGKTWYPWGLDGKGRTKAHIYRSIGWSTAKIASHITDPYQKFVSEYQELPAQCQRP